MRILGVALVLVASAAAVWDVRERKIPNALTVAGFALALATRAVMAVRTGNSTPLLAGLEAAGLAFAVLLPLFVLRALGGGDVKLMIAVAALLGIERFWPALLLSSAAAGVMAFTDAYRRGVIVPVLFRCGDMVQYCFTFGRTGRLPRLDEPGAVSIPYGVAIAVGSIACWFFWTV
jgi:prepilin peptidase CpaA